MAREGGFFSPNRKTSGKDKQVASSNFTQIDDTSFLDRDDDYNKEMNSIYGEKGYQKLPGFIKKDIKLDYLDRNPIKYKKFLDSSFAPSGYEVGKIARSEISEADDFKNYMRAAGIKYPKQLPNRMIQMLKENYQMDKKEGIYKDGQIFNRSDTFLNKAPVNTNTEIAGAFGMSDDEIERRKVLSEIINTPGYDPQSVTEAQRQLIRLNKGLTPFDKKVEAPKENILQKVGGFLANVFTGSQPVAAGTLDANQVAQVSERPKLSYVNPDATRMSLSEMADAFKPKNLFGYKDKFGRFDDPGSPLARDRAETIQRVAQNFSSPIVGDARTIGQIRADQDARMRENARLRNESFQRGERVQQKSADVTYGTNMLSNPAFGFRGRMTDDAKAKYDQSAKDATEMARTDPSLGNVLTSGMNFLKGQINKITGETALTREKSLEKIGERQLRLANKEINRPTYQKEAYARKFLGITNDQLKARNLQQIRANAAARNQAFQADRRAKAVERAARRYGQNTGSGRTGGFGSGTVGKGMSSNPKGMRQTGVGESANNLSRHSVGHSSTQPGSKGSGGRKGGGSKGGGSKGGGGGGTGGGGGGTGGGTSKGGAGRSASSASKGRTGRSRSQCDIRTKIDITQLTNPNLIKDDLAKVAYFVQELKEK